MCMLMSLNSMLIFGCQQTVFKLLLIFVKRLIYYERMMRFSGASEV